MNGFTFGWQILPDQMQVANPILTLTLIPIFNYIVYPALGRCGILKTPLQRIVTGCLLCGLAFVISGVLELQLKEGYPKLPEKGQTKLYIHNGLPDCTIHARSDKFDDNHQYDEFCKCCLTLIDDLHRVFILQRIF